jgi:hypothetical protein
MRLPALCALFLCGVSMASAQPRPELVRMVSAYPALASSPLPGIDRVNEIGTSSTTTDGRPTAYTVTSRRFMIGSAGNGLFLVRSRSLSSHMQAASGRYMEFNQVGDSVYTQALGGLYDLESQLSRSGGGTNFTIQGEVNAITFVEGELFPMAVGKRMKIRLTRTLRNSLARGTNQWDVETDFTVAEYRDVLEAEGLRTDGGIFKVERIERMKSSSLSIDNRITLYYSAKHAWVIGYEVTTSSSAGISSGRGMPILLLASADDFPKDELERFDRELDAVHRATSEAYLGPRRAQIAALVPGAVVSSQGGSTGCPGDSAGQAMQRALLTLGFQRIADKTSNLYIRGGAGVAGRLAGNC